MTPTEKPRWQYRFDNFSRAYVLLREAIEQVEERGLSQLEKEGVVQRFEYTMELAWKTMKDYLESQNVLLSSVTPRSVVKEAFAARLIEDGQSWMDALDARNKMSHTYNLKTFEEVIAAIQQRFLAVIEALHFKLLEEVGSQQQFS